MVCNVLLKFSRWLQLLQPRGRKDEKIEFCLPINRISHLEKGANCLNVKHQTASSDAANSTKINCVNTLPSTRLTFVRTIASPRTPYLGRPFATSFGAGLQLNTSLQTLGDPS